MLENEQVRCWICGETMPESDYDSDAGQCKKCEKENPMPLCMRSDFQWPEIY